MSLMISQIIDRAELTTDGKVIVRRWRTERATGTVELADLTVDFNDALGSTLDDKTTRLIRRRGRYESTKDRA